MNNYWTTAGPELSSTILTPLKQNDQSLISGFDASTTTHQAVNSATLLRKGVGLVPPLHRPLTPVVDFPYR